MVLTSFFIPALLALPGLATQHGSNNPHRHRGVARNLELQKKDDVVNTNTSNLSKRDFTGRMTYYQTGMGACGIFNNPGDFIVALNSAQYGDGYPGPQCWKYITITAKGKTATAQVTDQCPTCGYGELDLSQGLFQQFTTPDQGVFQATWWFNDGPGGGGDQPTSTSQTQEPTSQPPPPETTTSTWTPPDTTSTHNEPTSTSSTWSDTTTSTSSSTSSTSTTTSSEITSTSSTSTSASSSSTSTSSTENAQPTGVLADFGQALANLGRMAAAGAAIKA